MNFAEFSEWGQYPTLIDIIAKRLLVINERVLLSHVMLCFWCIGFPINAINYQVLSYLATESFPVKNIKSTLSFLSVDRCQLALTTLNRFLPRGSNGHFFSVPDMGVPGNHPNFGFCDYSLNSVYFGKPIGVSEQKSIVMGRQIQVYYPFFYVWVLMSLTTIKDVSLLIKGILL